MNLISHTSMTLRIALSRRNLLTLIKLLDEHVGQPELHRLVDADGTVLFVKAEEDMEHYNSASRQESARSIMGVGPDDVPHAWERKVGVFDAVPHSQPKE